MDIRPATEADLEAITAIYAHAVLHGTGTFELIPPDRIEMGARRAKVLAAGAPYLVAADAAGVQAFAYAGAFRERPAYRFTVEDSVYVAEAARGRGIGRALLDALVITAEAAGFRQMLSLIGDAANAGSIRLHEACGFAHAGVLEATGWKHGRWLDVVVMQRALGPGASVPPPDDRREIAMGETRRTFMAAGGAIAASGLGAGAAGAAQPFDLPQPCVPIAGGGRFPVRRIYCIGRNYPEHAREMGSDPRSEPPFFFQKPSDAVAPVAAGAIGEHPYPPLTQNYHHEIELVVALKSGGRDIPAARALDHVYGYAVGLDMTRRDRQQAMKDGRRPWEIGKSFDHSAPLGPVVPTAEIGHPAEGAIELEVAGAVRQRDDLAAMIWSVPEQIAELSKGSELRAGDLIFTGTPAGVGPVVRGDTLVGRIAGLPELRIRVV